MKISVVIPAYNEEKYIGKCLESVIKQERKPDEIIVVDNNSTDSTAEIVKKYKSVTLIKEKQQGIIPTRNIGFDIAKGDIIARCDADTIVPLDWIKKIEEIFLKNKSILAISMPVFVYDIPPFGNKFSFIYHLYMFIPRMFIGHYPLVGPSMAIRKNAWNKIRKELCTDAKAVHEDVDISLHIRKIGRVYHDHTNLVLTSGRRIKYKPWSFFGEYTWRFFKMLLSH
jgi:glycosyltransferase involved in cell wall biosynthesis